MRMQMSGADLPHRDGAKQCAPSLGPSPAMQQTQNGSEGGVPLKTRATSVAGGGMRPARIQPARMTDCGHVFGPEVARRHPGAPEKGAGVARAPIAYCGAR